MSFDQDKKDDTGYGSRMLRMMSNIETQYTMLGDVGVDDAVDPVDDEDAVARLPVVDLMFFLSDFLSLYFFFIPSS